MIHYIAGLMGVVVFYFPKLASPVMVAVLISIGGLLDSIRRELHKRE